MSVHRRAQCKKWLDQSAESTRCVFSFDGAHNWKESQMEAELYGVMEPPTDRKEKFSNQEIDIHAAEVSLNREILQGPNSTPTQKH